MTPARDFTGRIIEAGHVVVYPVPGQQDVAQQAERCPGQ